MGEVAATLAVGLCSLQALSGALVVWTRLSLFSTLTHAAVMALLFATLAQLARMAFSSAERTDFGAATPRLSDGAGRRLQRLANTPHG